MSRGRNRHSKENSDERRHPDRRNRKRRCYRLSVYRREEHSKPKTRETPRLRRVYRLVRRVHRLPRLKQKTPCQNQKTKGNAVGDQRRASSSIRLTTCK